MSYATRKSPLAFLTSRISCQRAYNLMKSAFRAAGVHTLFRSAK